MSSNTSASVVMNLEKSISLETEPVAETRTDNPYRDGIAVPATDLVIIHVRFWPDSRVWEIAECPAELTKEEWFKRLCMRIGDKYQTRAGGRGFFRLTRLELESLKVSNPH